jgi:hypothetical protein
MSKSVASWLAWALAALTILFYILSLIFSGSIPVDKLGQHSILWPFYPTDLGILVYAPIGALIATRRSNNPVGWIFLIIGLLWNVWGLTNDYVSYSELMRPGSLPLSSFVFWLLLESWVLPYFITPLLLLLFPNGHLPSRRWRPVIWLLAASTLLALLSSGSAVEAGSYHLETPSLLDYFGLGSARDSSQTIVWLSNLIIYSLGVVAIILRLRRARGEERQQLKWFSYAGAIFVLINVIEQSLFDNNILSRLDPSALVPTDLFLGIPIAIAFAVIPVAAAIAILRYRLYDIDIIIQRTIVYAVLTTILGLVYFGVIVVLQLTIRILTGQSSDLTIVASTIVTAALFTPVRRRVQDEIDQRFFRRKYNAEKVLTAFSTTVRDQVDLNKLTGTFLETVEETLQPERVALWLRLPEVKAQRTKDENQVRRV